jgi:hypothetical protein
VDITANKHVGTEQSLSDSELATETRLAPRPSRRRPRLASGAFWNATRSRSNLGAIVSSWPRKGSPNRLFLSNKRGEAAGHSDGPVGPLGFFGLAPAAFTGKVFTNAAASSSHALSALFVGTGGSI